MKKAVSPAAASRESALERGKTAYNAGNLSGAVSLLKEVVKGCCPNSTVTDGPCTCRDLLRALQENDLRGQLVTRCTCKAKLDKRCRDQSHMDALNLLALIAMKSKRSSKATSFATEMIWRNPRDPSGYLRLGQILRRDQKPDVAYDAYHQGAMLVAEKYPDHPRLEALRSQAAAVEKAMRKVDPILSLPLELINMIFSMLDTTEVCRCLQVSKSWKRKLESADARDVWLHQSYTLRHKTRGLTSKIFHRYIKAYTCGRLRGFSIVDESDFFAKNFASFSRSCGELQHLTLKGPIRLSDSLATTAIPYRLETLHIGTCVEYSAKSLDKFLTYCSKTLRELTLLSWPNTDRNDAIWEPSWPELPLLETFKFSCGGRCVRLSSIASRSPNVRELWLINIHIICWSSDVPDFGFWPKAERISCLSVRCPTGNLPPSDRPIFGLGGRPTELLIHKSDLDSFFVDSLLDEGSYDEKLANLKSLLIYDCESSGLDRLKRIIMPSLKSGTLEMLQLKPYPFPPERAPTESDYNWLRNDCVKHLTIGGLSLKHGLIDLDAALNSIVQQFGALNSLDIGAEIVRTETLVSFIKKRGIRSLYHNNPDIPTYNLRDWARENNLGDVYKRPYPGSLVERWSCLERWR